jgi:hypothetical protein
MEERTEPGKGRASYNILRPVLFPASVMALRKSLKASGVGSSSLYSCQRGVWRPSCGCIEGCQGLYALYTSAMCTRMDILMLYWEWVGTRAGRDTLYSFNHVFLAHVMSERSENRYIVSPTLSQPYDTINSYFLTRKPLSQAQTRA